MSDSRCATNYNIDNMMYLPHLRCRVKDHEVLHTGHKTRYWCSQDEDRKDKAKPSDLPGVVHRNTPGKVCFPCKSSLVIVCKRANPKSEDRLVTVRLKHLQPHVRATVALKD